MPWVAQLTSPMEAFGPWSSCGGMISSPFCYIRVHFLVIFAVGGVILGAPGHLGRILAPSSTGSAIMSELL